MGRRIGRKAAWSWKSSLSLPTTRGRTRWPKGRGIIGTPRLEKNDLLPFRGSADPSCRIPPSQLPQPSLSALLPPSSLHLRPFLHLDDPSQTPHINPRLSPICLSLLLSPVDDRPSRSSSREVKEQKRQEKGKGRARSNFCCVPPDV